MLEIFPPILRQFARQLPGVQVQLLQRSSGDQLAMLVDGTLDAGFGDLSAGSAQHEMNGVCLEVRPVTHERLMVALPPEHRLARQRKIALRELAAEPWIMLPRQPRTGFYDQTLGLCQIAGFSPRVAHEAEQLPTVLALVAAGLGVALVPDCLLRFWEGEVAFRPLVDPAHTNVTMFWRRDNRTPALTELVAIALQTCGLAPTVNGHRPSQKRSAESVAARN